MGWEALSESTTSEAVAQVRRFCYSVPSSSIRFGVNQLALTVGVAGALSVGAELWLRP